MFLGSKLTVSGYPGPSLVNYYPLSITKLLYVFQDDIIKDYIYFQNLHFIYLFCFYISDA